MDRELKILVEHLATKLRPETGKTIKIMTSLDQGLTLNYDRFKKKSKTSRLFLLFECLWGKTTTTKTNC